MCSTERKQEAETFQCWIVPPHLIVSTINAALPYLRTNYAVNIGAGDGRYGNDPVFPLLMEGYAGVAIEGDECEELWRNLPFDAVKKLTGTMVTPDNVTELLNSASCPENCDFFKIDIDGYDGVILRTILNAGFRPKVIQMEVNPEFPPPFEFSVMYHPQYRPVDDAMRCGGFYGASMSYVMNVTRPFGYRLACIDFVSTFTHDITLVHEDYFPAVSGLVGDAFISATPRAIFLNHPPGYSHFAEYNVDTSKWRHRRDWHQLLPTIWEACLKANALKHHGRLIPFHLSVGDP